MNTRPKVEHTKDGLFVIRFRQLPVNWDLKLDEAIRLGAPDTPSESLIWQAASQYPTPVGKSGIELADISLFGYMRGWRSEEAVDYAAKNNLPVALTRQVLAIGESFPNLPEDIGMEYVAAVSLQRCWLDEIALLQCLWYDKNGKREVITQKYDGRWLDYCWFAACV